MKLICDHCGAVKQPDGGQPALGEMHESCPNIAGSFRLVKPIGYLFQEGTTAHTGQIDEGFYVRLLLPSGDYLDVSVHEDAVLIVARPSKRLAIEMPRSHMTRVRILE